MTSISLEQTKQLSHPNTAIIILVIFYAVGILGTKLSIHPDFLLLTPFNLLLSISLVIWHHHPKEAKLWGFLLTCFIIGYASEVIGVNTGLIFGEYAYGPVLGWQLWDTPLMIGVNWAMLAYCSGTVINYLAGRLPWWLKGILSAALMVGLDVLIEPVAIRYDFWSWEQHLPPLQNYLGWFAVALPLLLLFHWLFKDSKNKVAIALFILQIAFFTLL